MSDIKPLEVDQKLITFGDFSVAVPKAWKSAPLYIRNGLGHGVKAATLCLERDKEGRRVVIISPTFTQLKASE